MAEEFNALKFAMETTHGYSTIKELVEKLESLSWTRQFSRKGTLLLKKLKEPVYCGIITEQSGKAIHYKVFLKYDSIIKTRPHLNSMAALRWIERYATNVH